MGYGNRRGSGDYWAAWRRCVSVIRIFTSCGNPLAHLVLRENYLPQVPARFSSPGCTPASLHSDIPFLQRQNVPPVNKFGDASMDYRGTTGRVWLSPFYPSCHRFRLCHQYDFVPNYPSPLLQFMPPAQLQIVSGSTGLVAR